MSSLRNRLLILIGIAEVLLVAGAFWLTYDKSRHEAEELLDGQLAISMRLIEAQIRHDERLFAMNGSAIDNSFEQWSDQSGIEEVSNTDRGPYEPEIAFGVWSTEGLPLLRSANARQMQRQLEQGFSDLQILNQPWRSYTKLSADGRYWIQVAHSIETRDYAGLEVAERVTYPMILALPLLLIVIYYAIHLSIKPVRQLAREISQRRGNDMAPIDTSGVIAELLPVIASFNQLLERVHQSTLNERRFTADAAHELRSPLAGLKVQAQVASESNDPVAQRRALDNVLLAVQRSERLVEQLLRLSKLDPADGGGIRMQPVDLRYLSLEALDATQHERVLRNQTVEFKIPDTDICVLGDDDLLLVMVTNILSNATKYAPPDTRVIVDVVFEDTSVALVISDEGPGIPEWELPEITKRFKRGDRSQGEGSGLGLAIVERICQLHDASLLITNLAQGGLCVKVSFSELG